MIAAEKVADMSDSRASQELHTLCVDVGCALADLKAKWEPILADAPNDPKLKELDERYMRPLKLDGLKLLKSLIELEEALNNPCMRKVVF